MANKRDFRKYSASMYVEKTKQKANKKVCCTRNATLRERERVKFFFLFFCPSIAFKPKTNTNSFNEYFF